MCSVAKYYECENGANLRIIMDIKICKFRFIWTWYVIHLLFIMLIAMFCYCYGVVSSFHKVNKTFGKHLNEEFSSKLCFHFHPFIKHCTNIPYVLHWFYLMISDLDGFSFNFFRETSVPRIMNSVLSSFNFNMFLLIPVTQFTDALFHLAKNF